MTVGELAMKTVFIINPMAGKNNKIDSIISAIRSASERLNKETEIYITKSVGDAEDFVRNYDISQGKVRFIACGGDGTFSEVINGAYGAKGVEVGVMPIGTGNDFCRNFPGDISFLDAERQINGKTVKCDVIRYTTEASGRMIQKYCANMFNIGFDCNVADLTSQMKTKPFISGSLAYFLSILTMLFKKKGANLEINIDGEIKHRGPLLLTSVANGSFCGGGIKSNPSASVNDGIIDVNIIYNISRLNFISKLPFYMKGTHTKLKNIQNFIAAYKCRKLTVTPLEGNMKLCVDGEIVNVGKTDFELIDSAIDFVLPDNCCDNKQIFEKELAALK